MKAKVKIEFYDTVEKKIRKKGEVIDVTPARFNEICRKGNYVEAAEEKAATPAVKA